MTSSDPKITPKSLNHNAKRILGFLFLFSVVVLTFLAILAIWDVLTEEILWKSFSTFLVLSGSAAASVVVLSNIDLGDKK